ncbi:MAG: acetoin utilization protein AcuC, partial [Pseudomonadota bacterium]
MIAHEIYRHSRYGDAHPLSIPRVSTCVDLCRALGWLPDDAYRESPKATPEQLARFHDRDYLAALLTAERDGALPWALEERYRLNRDANPIFPEVFSRPATACGSGLLAVDLLRDGGTVHSPAGGTHHGRPDRASGFCYLNDPVIALFGFLDSGLRRVLYVDLDAHRGDGVEDAFAGDPRVLTISIHEAGRWPGGGDAGWSAGGDALNLPLPPGAGDADLAYA